MWAWKKPHKVLTPWSRGGGEQGRQLDVSTPPLVVL